MDNNQVVYDVIISGAGLAGLSLAWQIRQAGLSDLTILLIDQDDKVANDRTWCWWENQPGPFEHLVYRSWEHLKVTSRTGQKMTIPLGDYRYKMIRGIDLYRFMAGEIQDDPHTFRISARVEEIIPGDKGVTVRTNGGLRHGHHLFDSTCKLPMKDARYRHLLQHFLGYVIRTDEPVFNPGLPDLMNFKVPPTGDCRFIYILPFSETEALVEYTLFTQSLLKREAYHAALDQWIRQELGLQGYQVLEEEFGVIPMSDEPVREFPHSRVTRIGTSGGYTNPSTGYTYATTQKRLAQLVDQYVRNGRWQVDKPIRHDRFNWYASVLLDVLARKQVPASKVFWDLYRLNPIDRVFRFLDGESFPGEEVRLMLTTPYLPFTRSGIEVIRRRLA